MRKTLIGLLLLGLPFFAPAQNRAYPESPVLLKANAPALQEVSYQKGGRNVHNFIYRYDMARRSPLYVALQLSPHDISLEKTPSVQWTNDPSIPLIYQPGDWQGAIWGFKRYTLIPSFYRNTPEAASQTLMRTITFPVLPSTLQMALIPLDKLIGKWASKSDVLYLCSGVIPNPYSIKDELNHEIAIPEAFYRAVVCKKGNTWSGIAFYIPHEYLNQEAKLQEYALPINEMEKELQMRFFANLPNQILQRIQNQSPSDNLWMWQ